MTIGELAWYRNSIKHEVLVARQTAARIRARKAPSVRDASFRLAALWDAIADGWQRALDATHLPNFIANTQGHDQRETGRP